MSEPNLINRGTLLGFILGVMLGTGATMGTVALLRARSQDGATQEQPRVEPPANTQADKRALEKRERDEKIRKLEQLAESLRSEIDASEKQIDLAARAKVEGADDPKRLAQLTLRLTETESDLNAVQRNVIKLEAEAKILQSQLKAEPSPVDLSALRKQVEQDPRVISALSALEAKQAELAKLKKDGVKDGDPRLVRLNIEVEKLQASHEAAKKTAEAEAIKTHQVSDLATRKARLSQIEMTLAVKREERDKLKIERDNLKRLIEAVGGNGPKLEAMRDALKPQREMLEKVNAELAKVRIEAKLNE